MKVLFVTSEIYPYVKTGGLADVCAALPKALADKGTDTRLFVPGYPEILRNLENPEFIRAIPFAGTDDLQLLRGRLSNGMTAYVLASSRFYDRQGLYVDASGHDWGDNHLRFGAFSHTAANLHHYDASWMADIIHINDWQSGLVPAYLKYQQGPKPSTVMTIHNMAFQGLFPHHVLGELGLPEESFSVNGLEFHDKVGFLKAGLYYSDRLTTVSPTYAKEIQTPEFGCGLEGLLRTRASHLTGILNGIDIDVWNPAHDPYLKDRYDITRLDDKQKNKVQLLQSLGLPVTDNPIFASVSRLTSQKGFDLLIKTAPALLAKKGYLIMHGTGDKEIENQLQDLARAYPDQVAVRVGYEESLAHRIQSGADAIVMPSRFEPCGLTQMYGLRYGTIPIVRRTGGLADTVVDAGFRKFHSLGNGLVFNKACASSLGKTFDRALRFFREPKTWRAMQVNAMAKEFSWTSASDKYRKVYQRAVA